MEALPVLPGLGWRRKLITQVLNPSDTHLITSDLLVSRRFMLTFTKSPALGLQHKLGDVRSAKPSSYRQG